MNVLKETARRDQERLTDVLSVIEDKLLEESYTVSSMNAHIKLRRAQGQETTEEDVRNIKEEFHKLFDKYTLLGPVRIVYLAIFLRDTIKEGILHHEELISLLDEMGEE